MHQLHSTQTQNYLLSYRSALPFFILFLSLLFSACSSDTPDNKTSLDIQVLPSSQSSAHTLSPELTTIYQETCTQCHLNSSTGAPISGDTNAWQKILSKGMNATLERAMNGYGGMPAAGQCFECTPEQMIELIKYMSQKS